MATIRKKTNKDGSIVYSICYRVSRDAQTHYMTWKPEKGWSEKYIERQLKNVVSEFETACRNGDVSTRKEKRAAEEEAERIRAEEELARQKAEAEAERQRQTEEQLHPTLKQYAERSFLPEKMVYVAPATMNHYRNIFNLYIFPALGDKKLEEITPKEIKELITGMQAEYSHQTVIHVFSTLTGIFKSAMLDDTISTNPMEKVRRPQMKKEDKKEGPEAYTKEEAAYILQCLESEPLRWQAFTRLMLDTGMRRGECCGLKWDDIDPKTRLVTIQRSLNYNPKDGVYEGPTKTGIVREVRITPEILNLLLMLRQETQENNIVSPYVFTQLDSADPMHPQRPNRWFQRFAKRHGIEHLHPHKLRHTMASISIEYGSDVASLAQKMGHAEITTTLNTYVRSNQDAVDRSSELFRNAIRTAQEALSAAQA